MMTLRDMIGMVQPANPTLMNGGHDYNGPKVPDFLVSFNLHERRNNFGVVS